MIGYWSLLSLAAKSALEVADGNDSHALRLRGSNLDPDLVNAVDQRLVALGHLQLDLVAAPGSVDPQLPLLVRRALADLGLLSRRAARRARFNRIRARRAARRADSKKNVRVSKLECVGLYMFSYQHHYLNPKY